MSEQRAKCAYEASDRFAELKQDIDDAICRATDVFFDIFDGESPKSETVHYPEGLDFLSECGVYKTVVDVKNKTISVFVDVFTEERPMSDRVDVDNES